MAPDEMPRGLLFFRPGTPASVRRRRLVFVAVVVVAAAGITWPLYPWFAEATPWILGLPLSLAWVLAWLFVVFGALLWLDRGEPDAEGERGRAGPS